MKSLQPHHSDGDSPLSLYRAVRLNTSQQGSVHIGHNGFCRKQFDWHAPLARADAKACIPTSPITRQHTYLELGASNGIDASNTRTLYEHLNWRGVLIEAAPQQCKNLEKNRPGDVVFCGAVCDQSFGGTLTFQTDQNKGGLVGHSVVRRQSGGICTAIFISSITPCPARHLGPCLRWLGCDV